MNDERTSWDRRYQEGSHGSHEPDSFLVNSYAEFIEPLFPKGGVALDVAGGFGRHAIWLAERRWRVTLSDISEVGIAKAREHAGELAKQIDFQVCDLSNFSAGNAPYNLILGFFYL